MNKIFLTLIFGIFIASPVSLFASSDKDLFEIEVQKIASTDKANVSDFYFSPKDIQDNSKIASWRMRFNCDKNMAIKFIDNSRNVCGKAVKFSNGQFFPGKFTFENLNTKGKKFSFALKAYDNKGKWIHTERQNFNWK